MDLSHRTTCSATIGFVEGLGELPWGAAQVREKPGLGRAFPALSAARGVHPAGVAGLGSILWDLRISADPNASDEASDASGKQQQVPVVVKSWWWIGGTWCKVCRSCPPSFLHLVAVMLRKLHSLGFHDFPRALVNSIHHEP